MNTFFCFYILEFKAYHNHDSYAYMNIGLILNMRPFIFIVSKYVSRPRLTNTDRVESTRTVNTAREQR